MKLNIINSKIFFGTDSSTEAKNIISLLEEYNIRCRCDTFQNYESFKFYSTDPFHTYSSNYLKNVHEFHLIRVHKLDFKDAINIYNNNC